MEDLDKIPRVKSISRDAGLLVREYALNQANTAKAREMKAREEELTKREAAVTAAERTVRVCDAIGVCSRHRRRCGAMRA